MSDATQASITAEYMEPQELARELGKSERTLHRWHVERVGPPRVVVGRMVLYRRASVLEWLRSLEQSQPRSRQGTA
jgi:predicted DNA-binding transcriptional regulator AlpA